MAKQLFDIGTTLTIEDDLLECTVVGYEEVDGIKTNFNYTFRPRVDLEREKREAEERKRIADQLPEGIETQA